MIVHNIGHATTVKLSIMIIIHQRAGVFGPGPTRGRWARGSSTSPGAVPKFGRGTTAAEGPNERSKEVVVSGARGGGGLGTLTCGSVLCLTLVRRLQDKPTHGQKYTHNRMRKKKQGPVWEAPRPPPWTAKGAEPHPVPQRNAQVGPHSALKWTLRSSTRPSPPPAGDPHFVKLGFAPVCNRQVRN